MWWISGKTKVNLQYERHPELVSGSHMLSNR